MTASAAASQPRERALVRAVAARAHLFGLAAVLAVAAFLDLWRLDRNGYANTYYAGAVKSMTTSWHNFLFASFDPGGLVSVDKPPLALWLEAASARLFGYSGFTILLPEALAGVAAVAVLYLLVSRYYGRVAGLVAALALAVSPVSVAVNRDNNPDALFALLLVVAVYLGVRAAESGRLRWLLGTAVAVGLAFNTKMLASLIVLPGLAVAYLFFAPRSWRVRAGHLAAAAAVLVVVGGAWIAAVELTPAADRPYVGSTSDNSALSLALDYNGLGRITGQTGGTSFGGGIGGAFSGSPGVFRLFNDALGDQGGWLVPLAVVGALSLLLAVIRRRRRIEAAALTAIGGWFVSAAVVFSYAGGIIHTYYLSALAPATCALVGAGAISLWRDARRGGAWVLLPLAAIAGTAWLELVVLRRSGYLSWLQFLMLALAAAAALGFAVLAFRGVGTTRSRALLAGAALAAMLAGFLAAPTAWSATTLTAPVNGVFPGAGPSFVSGLSANARGAGGFGGRPTFRGGGGFGPPPGAGTSVRPPRAGGFPGGGLRAGGLGGFGGGTSTETTAALQYVKAHGAAKRFGLIVSSEQSAAPYVIKGEPVAAMGGFTGRETVLTRSYLAQLVRSGDARYFLLGGGGGFGPGAAGQSNEAVTTITSACKQVTGWSGAAAGGSTLYDCAGRASAIESAG